jgi:hypothetical protein
MHTPDAGSTAQPTRHFMNSLGLDGGWPFGGLVDWWTTPRDTALHSGVITEKDEEGRLLVRKADGAIHAIEPDHAPPIFGVDGYRRSLGDLRIGDCVEISQEKRGATYFVTEVRLLWPR